jgi:hypothetical protein
MKTKIIHMIFLALIILPYFLLKLFFYNTGWIGVFVIFYLFSPAVFGLYLHLLKKRKVANARHLVIISIIFLIFLSFILWNIYNIILSGFNFKML